MDLVNKDGDRVQRKLASVPEEDRRILQRKGSASDAKPAAAKPKITDNMTASVLAGFVHGIIVMMSFGSFAIVIFGQSEHPELQAALSLAISQQVMSASVLIGLLTYNGFFPFTMGGPTPPAALLIADVVRAVVDNVDVPEKKVPTAILTIALVSILMGGMLCLISYTKTTVYALQLPFPVLCGFLGSVGVLLMRNAFSILLNIKLKWTFIPVSWDKAAALDPVGVVCQLGLGIGVALILLKGVPFVRGKLSKKAGLTVLPTLFLFPLVAFYVAILAGGLDMGIDSDLRSMKPAWLSPASTWTWAPKDFFSAYLDVANWDLVAILSPEALMRMFISSFLCVIAALINMAGIETNAPQAQSLDLDKEFMMLGRANLIVGLLGGHPGHHVAAFTLPMKKDGGTSRIAPWTASMIWFLAFISAAPLSFVIPRFFFGGCFLQVGFGLARTFLWDNRKGLDRPSIVIAYMTVLVAVFTDLNIASGVGFLLVAVNFVRLSMDQQVVRDVARADQLRAPKYRTNKELQMLKIHGHKIMVLYLEGHLFWGTVDEITSAFAELIDGTDDDPEIIFVDMRYVNGVELSVLNTFRKLARLAAGVGIAIKLCSLPSEDVIGPGLRSLLAALPFASTKDLCSLIEEQEDKLLDEWTANSPTKTYAVRRSTRSRSKLFQDADKQYNDVMTYWNNKVFKTWAQWIQTKRSTVRMLRSTEKQLQLEEMIEVTDASYGIRWECIGGELVMCHTHLPSWRAEQLVMKSLRTGSQVRTYVTASEGYPINVDLDDPAVSATTPVAVAMEIGGSTGEASTAVSEQDAKKQAQEEQSTIRGIWCAFKEAAGSEMVVQPVTNSMREAGLDDITLVDPSTASFMAQSAGMDVLARAFLSKKAIICTDIPSLLEAFVRQDLAMEFNIKKAIFIPTADGGVVELGAVGKPSEIAASVPQVLDIDPALLTNMNMSGHLCGAFVCDDPTEVLGAAPDTNANLRLGKQLSYNLILSIATLGDIKHFTQEDPIVTEPKGNLLSTKSDEVAQDIYLVLDGIFGTYKKKDDEEEEEIELMLKSPEGCMMGAEDVWANRPRSCLLKLLSEEGTVAVLPRKVVKAIELCSSPFAGPAETEEFIDFMKRETSLNMSIMEVTFRNP